MAFGDDTNFVVADTAKREGGSSARARGAPKPFLKRGQGVEMRMNAYKMRKSKPIGEDNSDSPPGTPPAAKPAAGRAPQRPAPSAFTTPAAPTTGGSANWAGIVFSPDPEPLQAAARQLYANDRPQQRPQQQQQQQDFGPVSPGQQELTGTTLLVEAQPRRGSAPEPATHGATGLKHLRWACMLDEQPTSRACGCSRLVALRPASRTALAIFCRFLLQMPCCPTLQQTHKQHSSHPLLVLAFPQAAALLRRVHLRWASSLRATNTATGRTGRARTRKR